MLGVYIGAPRVGETIIVPLRTIVSSLSSVKAQSQDCFAVYVSLRKPTDSYATLSQAKEHVSDSLCKSMKPAVRLSKSLPGTTSSPVLQRCADSCVKKYEMVD